MKKFNTLFALLSIYFSAFSQAPTITSFSPASGPVGTLVHILGTNLNTPTAFTIGGVSAILISGSGDSIVGMVMPGAATGGVSVTTSGGMATASGSSFTVTVTGYPHYQQGAKLVGTGSVGSAYQGGSVAISADGNTAIVGGYKDSIDRGTAWIFIRQGGIWVQQGSKLIGSGAVGFANQGQSVAISADGNTAIVGGFGDSVGTGAAWVFTRSDGIWTQQGSKLVGIGAVGSYTSQGWAVAISADGNTAIVGGYEDNGGIGAVWVFTRSGAIWTQQGSKLVGSGFMGSDIYQGWSLALSADGNTAIVGGSEDNDLIGAAWIFTRSGGIWTQQGSKLVGSGAVGKSYQGWSVALSADGNTAIVGGIEDSIDRGAAWIYTRSGSQWTQQGSKLVGTGAVVPAWQGSSVALSADGNTAIIGGSGDVAFGAIWVFTRSGAIWTQQGSKLVGAGAVAPTDQGASVVISADGNTAMVGGYADNNNIGAAWVFVSTPCFPDSSSFTHAMCQGDTFAFDNMPLTSSGTYIDTLTNVSGCDSIVTLTLTVNPLPVVSFVQNDTTVCTDCSGSAGGVIALTGGMPAGGVYSGPYVAGDSIIVPVVIWDSLETVTYTYTDSNGCSSSASHLFWIMAVEGLTQINSNNIHLYPDPNKGSFTLQTSGSIGSEYTISDMLGHVIMKGSIKSDNETIELPDAAEGVYTLAVKGVYLPSAGQPIRFVIVR